VSKRLTDEYIKHRKPPASGQELEWDNLVPGFGVRFTPNAISFVVQWRDPTDGKKPRESLKPRFPQLSTASARDRARKRLLEVVGNPEAQESRPLRIAMREWYERQCVTSTWRPRYREKVNSLIHAYVEGNINGRIQISAATREAIDTLGHRPVGSVKRVDVMAVVDGLKRGAADNFMAIGSSFYGDMIERGVECPNPFRNRLRVTGGRRIRTRKFTEAEFLKLWRAFEEEGDPAFTVFAVLAYTGCRRREATRMTWSELDLDAATWTLPPERRKNGNDDPEPFVLHLHPWLVAALRRQPVLAGNPYVFWGRRDEKAFEFNYSLMRRLEALQIPDWRFHDLRRFIRSHMGALGVSQMVGELCLGHIAKAGLVKVYDGHDYDAEMKAAWLKWGDKLLRLTAGA
jgi:integrase